MAEAHIHVRLANKKPSSSKVTHTFLGRSAFAASKAVKTVARTPPALAQWDAKIQDRQVCGVCLHHRPTRVARGQSSTRSAGLGRCRGVPGTSRCRACAWGASRSPEGRFCKKTLILALSQKMQTKERHKRTSSAPCLVHKNVLWGDSRFCLPSRRFQGGR